jgi:uncharacterized protein YaaR (DUF327 family)
MRIKDAPTQRQIDKKKTPLLSPASARSSRFASALTEKRGDLDSYMHEVSELRQEIEEAGDRLEQEPSIEHFKIFRDLLSQLAKRVTTEAYRLEKIGGTPNNPRYFEIIRVINHEAEALCAAIIREQRNRMDITSRVIGLKGLVVDLLT